MKKEELLHFFDSAMSSDSYYNKLLICDILRHFVKIEIDLSDLFKLETIRKLQLRDTFIKNEGHTYFVKENLTQNLFIVKYDVETEFFCLQIDLIFTNTISEIIKESLEEEISFY